MSRVRKGKSVLQMIRAGLALLALVALALAQVPEEFEFTMPDGDVRTYLLWVPEGFAHGFLTLSPVAEVQYKARGFWNKDCERAIRWDDASIGIRWPLDQLGGAEVSLSGKDAEAPTLDQAKAAGDVF